MLSFYKLDVGDKTDINNERVHYIDFVMHYILSVKFWTTSLAYSFRLT